MVKLASPLIEGRFVRRLNRFAAVVQIDGREVLAHVANSGRLQELLQPGNRVLLTPVASNYRKTPFNLALVDLGRTLVSADARLPATLVHEAIQQGALEPFHGYAQIRREATYGDSRLDLVLEGPSGLCYLEVKSVTLVKNGVGLFPDAPTMRGQRHVLNLAQAVHAGHRAAVVFVVQREDVATFAPNDATDPAFGQALRRAVREGVEAYAFRCRVAPTEVQIERDIPVTLSLWSNG